MLDAGTFYTITELSDTLLAGRWTDGSYLLTEMSQGNVQNTRAPAGILLRPAT